MVGTSPARTCGRLVDGVFLVRAGDVGAGGRVAGSSLRASHWAAYGCAGKDRCPVRRTQGPASPDSWGHHPVRLPAAESWGD